MAEVWVGTMVRGRGAGWGLTGLSVWFPATIHGGIHDASSGDCGVLAQVQCPEKTEGESCLLGCQCPEIMPFDRATPGLSQKEALLLARAEL